MRIINRKKENKARQRNSGGYLLFFFRYFRGSDFGLYDTPGVKTSFEIFQKCDDMNMMFFSALESEKQGERCRKSQEEVVPKPLGAGLLKVVGVIFVRQSLTVKRFVV